ncbi:Thioredoxin domain-containing protein 11 [Trichoplax sp. H2]|nr:Thioredoxin domain-containing protein 11 [Trichoplax sp. H2]|eukprot:RDD43984.1 Thioredoxin domain-containing protein 11 [Trichoplax sp. H2]
MQLFRSFIFCFLTLIILIVNNQHCLYCQNDDRGHLFAGNPNIVEVDDGSLDKITEAVLANHLVFVMFYAPWCYSSHLTANHFAAAADRLSTLIVFISVNCWVPDSECYKKYKFAQYPQFYAHMQDTNNPIIYTDEPIAAKMVKFLLQLLKPVREIRKKGDLELLLSESPNSLFVGYLGEDWFNSTMYSELVLTSLKSIANDMSSMCSYLHYHWIIPEYPRRLPFAMDNILNWTNSKNIKLVNELVPNTFFSDNFISNLKKTPSVIMFTPLNDSSVARKVLHEYKLSAFSYWKKRRALLKRSRNEKTCDLRSYCLSYPSSDQKMNICDFCMSCCRLDFYCHYSLRNIQQIFSGYFKHRRNKPTTYGCSSIYWTNYYRSLTVLSSYCCLDESSSKIINNSNISNAEAGVDLYTTRIRIHNISCNGSNIVIASDALYNYSSKVTRQRFFHLETTCKDNCVFGSSAILQYGLSNVAHIDRSKVELHFYYIDSGSYWQLAINLGVEDGLGKSRIALAIIDLNGEVQYVEKENRLLTVKTISYFLQRYLRRQLVPRRRHVNTTVTDVCQPTEDYPCLIDISYFNFNEVVLNKEKNVLLIYYAPGCGVCLAQFPTYLKVVHYFLRSPNITVARIDGERNDLPVQYKAYKYPALILFPAHRKGDSVPFPENEVISVASVIEFVLRHSYW